MKQTQDTSLRSHHRLIWSAAQDTTVWIGGRPQTGQRAPETFLIAAKLTDLYGVWRGYGNTARNGTNLKSTDWRAAMEKAAPQQ